MSERETRGANEAIDFNDELRNRREKLAALRQQGVAFPNDFRRDHTSDQLHEEFDAKDNQELESLNIEVSVAGRMMTRRIMGKASFVTLQDVGGRIQLYVARDSLPEGVYNDQFKKWDLGDIIGARGTLFKTQTGELSIHCTELRLLKHYVLYQINSMVCRIRKSVIVNVIWTSSLTINPVKRLLSVQKFWPLSVSSWSRAALWK